MCAGVPVVGVEDFPGLDVGDGPLDDLADPVDALVGLLRGLAQFAVGWLLMGRDHSLSDIVLVGDPPGLLDGLDPGFRQSRWGDLLSGVVGVLVRVRREPAGDDGWRFSHPRRRG